LAGIVLKRRKKKKGFESPVPGASIGYGRGMQLPYPGSGGENKSYF